MWLFDITKYPKFMEKNENFPKKQCKRHHGLFTDIATLEQRAGFVMETLKENGASRSAKLEPWTETGNHA